MSELELLDREHCAIVLYNICNAVVVVVVVVGSR